MLTEIIREAWVALKRNYTRSMLTMLGIVWGIATVTLLVAYGSSFRNILVGGFNAFGKSVVICWPQQTSEQPGGQRAGKKVVIEQADVDMVKADAPLVKYVCRETVRRPGIAYQDRMVGTAAVRGVCPEYGEMRNEVPSEGRWFNSSDELERRRVCFLGGRIREQLFSGRPAVGETVAIGGVRFTVVGVMERKIQLSNYFSSDDESVWIPFSTAGDLWNTRYAAVLLFEPIAPQFEKKAMAQVLAAIATRQQFSPTDKKAFQMFGRDEFRPVIDAITIGLEVLLTFVGALTLGIGGVGVMNIMLVSVEERIREIESQERQNRFNKGVPDQITQYSVPYLDRNRFADFGMFVQDQWAITRSFNVTLGLRYELIFPYTETVVESDCKGMTLIEIERSNYA